MHQSLSVEVGHVMERIVEELFAPSKQYKAQIIRREDGLYLLKVYRWQEDCGYEFWSDITQGVSFIDTEVRAREIAREQLNICSNEFM